MKKIILFLIVTSLLLSINCGDKKSPSKEPVKKDQTTPYDMPPT